MKKFYVIPLALAMVGLVGHLLLMGFNFEYLLVKSALAIVVVASIFLLRMQYSFGEMVHAFRCAGKSYAASREELAVAESFFASARVTLIGTSLLGTVFGFIRVMDGANHGVVVDQTLTGFGIASVALLYGLLFNVFLVAPFAGGVRKKLAMLPQQ